MYANTTEAPSARIAIALAACLCAFTTISSTVAMFAVQGVAA